MTATFLSQANLQALAAEMLAAGTRVVAPLARTGGRGSEYRTLGAGEAFALAPELPSRSLKEFFMPPTEVLLRWRRQGGKVELDEVPTTFPKQVVLAARPCDAAAVEILDRVMGWDYRDELWFGRREATTIVSLACDGVDRSCFCSAVGLGPDARRGADALLVPVAGGYVAEAVTEKGAALFAQHARLFEPAGARGAEAEAWREKARAKVEANLSAPTVAAARGWLALNFEAPFWKDLALRCHGCGACASVCPTCHCFDIVDEPRGVDGGERRRNWDTCQTGKFTLHASGHNPRAGQNERFRQRVMHKFFIYPKRFEQTLCTGCGRCARACPGGMDLPEVLQDLGRLAGAPQGGHP